MKKIFNDYDADGNRISIMGCRSSIAADNNLVYNLRFRWPKELESMSDVSLVNAYDTFAATDLFGDNDARFLAFLGEH